VFFTWPLRCAWEVRRGMAKKVVGEWLQLHYGKERGCRTVTKVFVCKLYTPCKTYRRVRVTYGLRSVSQYVLVSSLIWDFWPDIASCSKVAVWKLLSCICGAPFLTRGRDCTSWVSVCGHLSLCILFNIYIFMCLTHFINAYTIYTRPLSIPVRYSSICPSYSVNSTAQLLH
jgi:hypothetical protein